MCSLNKFKCLLSPPNKQICPPSRQFLIVTMTLESKETYLAFVLEQQGLHKIWNDACYKIHLNN